MDKTTRKPYGKDDLPCDRHGISQFSTNPVPPLETEKRKKVTLNLVGLDGNAFVLLGAFRKAALKQGWTEAEVEVVLKDAKSGDYDHLLCVLMDNTEPIDEDED